MKAAVLFGNSSGTGGIDAAGLAAIGAWLEGCTVAVCEGAFGAPIGGAQRLAAPCGRGYVADLAAAAAALCAWKPDLLVCVGGDGLASYAADAMIASGADVPMAGIAAGTANVGPIIGMQAIALRECAKAASGEFLVTRAGAVEARSAGRHLGYGFNDVVIAESFLGTLDGTMVNLSAAAMLEEGLKIAVLPEADIVTGRFTVRLDGQRCALPEFIPKQIVASMVRKGELFGRAMAGVLCTASYEEGLAALALLDTIVVQAGNHGQGFGNFAQSSHMVFGPGSIVGLSGLSGAAFAVVDGNPWPLAEGSVELAAIPDLVRIARPVPRKEGEHVRQVR
jgi:hypothetical protein